jgi:hypothetical protein
MLILRTILSLVLTTFGCATLPSHPTSRDATGQHSDAFFERLHQEEQKKESEQGAASSLQQAALPLSVAKINHPDGDYLIATGQGDLTKGKLVCQRIADSVARMELAKQIRVHVKEHSVDRVREQTGKPFEQDIEIVREETANELLQDVEIVSRGLDEAAHTCTSTAIMPKSRIMQKLSGADDATPSNP